MNNPELIWTNYIEFPPVVHDSSFDNIGFKCAGCLDTIVFSDFWCSHMLTQCTHTLAASEGFLVVVMGREGKGR